MTALTPPIHIAYIEFLFSSNPRQTFISDDDPLLLSMQQHGVLEPLDVRVVKDRLEVLRGGRRLAVAQRLALAALPVRIWDVTDTEALAIIMLDNIDGYSPSPEEDLQSLQALHREFGVDTGVVRPSANDPT